MDRTYWEVPQRKLCSRKLLYMGVSGDTEMTLQGMSKDAMLQRLRDWSDPGEVCDIMKITVEDLLVAFGDKFDDAWEAELAREQEEGNE